MGFRCPFCKADFGHDKTALEQHMKGEKETPSIEALATTHFADTLKNVLKQSCQLALRFNGASK